MKRENFYRRDPGAALAGMAGMTLEERGVYNTIIDLLYLTWRPVEDNRAYIAGHCGCAVQKLNPLITKLIAAGKLVRFEDDGQGYISNPAFERERASVKGVTTRSGRGKVEEKSGGVGEKSAGVGKNPPSCLDEGEQNQPLAPLDKSREDKSRHSEPNGSGAVPSPDVFLASLEGLDPKARAWKIAKVVLVERGGMNPTRAGDLVGKLIRDHKLDMTELVEISEAAWRNGTEAPVQYLTKAALEVAKRRNAAGGQIAAPSERQQIAWMEDWRASPASWTGQRGPRPGQPGCRVSAEILARFGVEVAPVAANEGRAA